jgi:hypothetical protein
VELDFRKLKASLRGGLMSCGGIHTRLRQASNTREVPTVQPMKLFEASFIKSHNIKPPT